MTIVESLAPPHPPVPDDLTVVQFLFDATHTVNPVRANNAPLLIDAKTSRKLSFDEAKTRVSALANGLSAKCGLREDDVVCMLSPNHIEYPLTVWAAQRLGAVVTFANPASTSEELAHVMKTTKASAIVTHFSCLRLATSIAASYGIPSQRIVLIEDVQADPTESGYLTINALVDYGHSHPNQYHERALGPGEAKTKVAFLCFSSGTTGKPKAVAIPHYAPISNAIQVTSFWRINDDSVPLEDTFVRLGDTALAVTPFFHSFGVVMLMTVFVHIGLGLVIVPRFDFEDILAIIAKLKITHLPLTPSAIVLLCKHPSAKQYDFSHVRMVQCGGAPLSEELTKQLIPVAPSAWIGQGYGMTELSVVVTLFPLEPKVATPGSAGRLLPGWKAMVRKADGSLAGYRERGELVVTGPSVALGYLGNEEATKETFVDGWVRTGDEAIIEENGDIFIKDRLKELIKVRAFQVAPAELEGHLLQHPDIADVCVVGVPDEYNGEIPAAFVVLHKAAAVQIVDNEVRTAELKKEIIKYVSRAKAPYKWLAGGVEFIDALPRTSIGKLLRRELRDRIKVIRGERDDNTIDWVALEDMNVVPKHWTPEDLYAWLFAQARDASGGREIDPEGDLFGQGFDSFSTTLFTNRIKAAMRSSQVYGVEQATRAVSQSFVYSHPTIRQLSYAITTLFGSGGANGTPEKAAGSSITSIEALISKYSTNMPMMPTAERITETNDTETVVLLTGSTGSLGSHILARLLADDKVARVYAYNRKISAFNSLQRQTAGFEDKGLSLELLSSSKLVFVEGDATQDRLDMESPLYDKMHSSVTHIIHNAWKLDFNLTLPSFEPQIRATSNLIRFAAASPLASRIKLIFTSSVSVAQAWGTDRGPYPEEPVADARTAVGGGYGEAKYICERLLKMAAVQGLQTCAMRIGQISGGLPNGAWAITDWVPIIIKSGYVLGCLPVPHGTVAWLPMHSVADSVLEIGLANERLPAALNIVHPRPTKWTTIMKALRSALKGAPDQETLQLVTFQGWVDRLEKRAVAHREEDFEMIPALKLVDFFRRMADIDAKLGDLQAEIFGFPSFSTRETETRSPAIAGLQVLNQADARLWVQYWKSKGFF